jgi:hypothetical protein
VPLFGQALSATFVKEDCQFTLQNSTMWDYPNQTSTSDASGVILLAVFMLSRLVVIVGEADDSTTAQVSNAQVGKDLSGIIGLGTAKLTTSSTDKSIYTPQFGDSPFGQWLSQNPTALNVSVGIALNPPRSQSRGNTTIIGEPDEPDDAGTLHMLQPDSSAYVASKLVWKTVDDSISPQLPISSNATSGADWFINLDGWVATAGSIHLSNSQSFVATVDPLYSDMYLPASQAKTIRACSMCFKLYYNRSLSH